MSETKSQGTPASIPAFLASEDAPVPAPVAAAPAAKKESKVRMVSKREQALEAASDLITGNREREYGSPQQNFERIAKMWSVYLNIEVEPKDVTVMMVLLKAARLANDNTHEDSYVDMAGYAALGTEVE